MTKHSPARAGVALWPGLELLARGKVRDTYRLSDELLLVVATDGISIFDFVLNALVSGKGIILNAMNHFWLELFKEFGIKTHFIAAGLAIDRYLPRHLEKNPDLQSRAMVVRKLEMAPVEFIGRVVLTGSAVGSYQKTGKVCGHFLPPGLQDGDQLPFILDTPTTKAEEGHDQDLLAQQVREQYSQQTYVLLQVLQIASWHAEQRGIKVADTKIECGIDGSVGDELLTPDSSRFWDLRVWRESRKVVSNRKAPPPFDKQLVRAWGIEQGINKLDPNNPDDVTKVHSLVVPENLIRQTTQTYRYIFWRLTEKTIEAYLHDEMGVVTEKKAKNIVIVCGSDSDLPTIKGVLSFTHSFTDKITVHIMSCHRNPEAVREFVKEGCDGADVVIGVGGKALVLPGMIDAFLYASGKDIPVIGVALGELGTKSFEAAKLSIEEIPGAPVIMDEINGTPYMGPAGLERAIYRIVNGELPPLKPRTEKPAQKYVWRNF